MKKGIFRISMILVLLMCCSIFVYKVISDKDTHNVIKYANINSILGQINKETQAKEDHEFQKKKIIRQSIQPIKKKKLLKLQRLRILL